MEEVLSATAEMLDEQNTGQDSGNDSISSTTNLDECSSSSTTDLHSCCERFQYLLSEKEQSVLAAAHNARKLRSELERLGKSEQWYREKVAQQKSTHRDAVERLYAQECRYMQENQRLQDECMRLYAKCTEMEAALEAHKHTAQRELDAAKQSGRLVADGEQSNSAFELDKCQALIRNQQDLIAMLKKQRQELLADLQLQYSRMNSECLQMASERSELAAQLECSANALRQESAEKQQLQDQREALQARLCAQEQLLASRELEIADLQRQFEAQLKAETDMDVAHCMCMAYHEQVNAKTLELRSLKTAHRQLADELSDLQAHNAQLECRLAEQQRPSAEIGELQLALANCRSVHEAQLSDTQRTLAGVEEELRRVHSRYADVCALYERAQFDLQMHEIAQKKLKFQTQIDRADIDNLRIKLSGYFHQTGELSTRIASLEREKAASDSLTASMERRNRNVQNDEQAGSALQTSESMEGAIPLGLPLGAAETALREDRFQLASELPAPQSSDAALEEELAEAPRAATQEAQTQTVEHPDDDATALERGGERVQLIQQLLAQQDGRVAQLHAAQIEWEELLQLLTETQKLEQQNRAALAAKHSELDELNTLFAQQNGELRQLQAHTWQQQQQQKAEADRQRETFHRQLNELRAQLQQQIGEGAAQCDTIVALQRTNEALQRRLDDDGAATEIVGPPSQQGADSAADETESASCDSEIDSGRTTQACASHVAGKRYDLHVSTLLSNVRTLKRSLRRAEHKSQTLHGEQAKTNVQLRLSRMQLEELRVKCKGLAQQLEIERKRYDETDLGKSHTTQAQPTHEVSNLIDDYKKLIQLSAASTQRLRSGAILDLIQRSNQCVPNLRTIEASVADLHSDVQQMLSSCYAQQQRNGAADVAALAGFYSTLQTAPSLLDELRVAQQL